VSTRLEVDVAGRGAPAADRLVVAVFGGEKTPPAALSAAAKRALSQVLRRRGWKGEGGQSAEIEVAPGRVIAIYGLGRREDLTGRGLAGYIEKALSASLVAGDRHCVLVAPDHPLARGEAAAARWSRVAALATYRFDTFLSEAKRQRLSRVTFVPPSGDRPAWKKGVETGTAVAAGVELARNLANTPPNQATPAWMAARARELARRHGARVQVLAPAELKRRGMGGILAVGGGSVNSPRLVRIELGRGDTTVALVGKGVTFDTGGISIKPAAQMDEMKWDKCGACGVLGILEAAARLELPIRIRAYLPLAENMPDGAAYRPGDIVRCANGKTVEILNTDAEGRMILADALSWASQEKPDHLVEYSTLTGACVVALGQTGAGLFTPDDAMASELLDEAESAGERLWRLPLWEEFLEEMRGAHGDLKNSGGRWGGASTAAAFLSQFVGRQARWAHLDIAGPAYRGDDKRTRSATGYGVALTIGWLRRLERIRRR